MSADNQPLHAVLVPDLLYVGSMEPPQAQQAVRIENGTIKEVGPAADLRTRALPTHALTGTLMPGMVDCHTHLCLDASADPGTALRTQNRTRTTLQAVRNMALHLAAGVTTVRDLGCPDGLDLELANAQFCGHVAGPRVVAAGRLVAMTGGHACYLGVEADGVDGVVHAVREQIKAGSQLIKLIATGGVISPGVEPGAPQLTVEEMTAAVNEAVRAGRKVAAHAQGTVGIMNALTAGVHSIEHGFWLDDACTALMKTRGTHLVATFAAAQAMMDHLEEIPAFMRIKMEAVGPAHAHSFRRALDAGVALAAGTDAGTPFNPHGCLWREAALMVAHGASPLAALHAATGAAGALLGTAHVGKLTPGAQADMVLVARNPAVEIEALRRVSAVWQKGRAVDLGGLRFSVSSLGG